MFGFRRRLKLRRTANSVHVLGPPSDIEAVQPDILVAVTPFQGVDYPGRIVVDRPTRRLEPSTVMPSLRGRRPFIPDTIADGWSTNRFCVRAASVRGDAHRYDGSPRQDEFIVAHHPASESLIVAVADGVSSASAACDGALTVCHYATAAILDSLDQGRDLDWTNLFQCCAWSLIELAQRRVGDDADLQVAESLFATTLTIAVLTPRSGDLVELSTASIGDSALWILHEGDLVQVIGGKSEAIDGEPFSSTVAALPRLPPKVFSVKREMSSDDVMLVISDGIGDPLSDGTGLVGELLKSELKVSPETLQFARIADFSRATFIDDRTLVAVWPINESSETS